MQDAAMIRRFKGAVQLVTLHLWRVGKTTDVDICIEKAKELGMIGDDDETFITECISLNDTLSTSDKETASEASKRIDNDLIHEVQMCAIRLNSADPA
ncbi:MAG: hypothetical protein HFJ64_05705 [Eggerthellaceae bacterium]|nr:hypothetical protein [Eggerthellaceae bacterium]